MKLPWPEITSSHRPDLTIRQILDYLVWITRDMRLSGFHRGPSAEAWRWQAQTAYRALFLPPVAGHGDRYPPDVPPAKRPGTWPDIPAGLVPGMTVRHQLKVIELLAKDLRDRVWAHGREPEFQEWDRRLCAALEALDHADLHPMPEEARTEPSAAAIAEAEAQEQARRELVKKRERRLKMLQKKAAKKSPAAKAPSSKAKASRSATRKSAKSKKVAGTAARKAKAAGKKKAVGKKVPHKASPKESAKRKTTSVAAKAKKKRPASAATSRKATTGRTASRTKRRSQAR